MVIVDTGFWLALANKKDSAHQLAKVRFVEMRREGFVTTWCVITETCYLLQQRVGIDAPNSLLSKVSGGSLQVFDLTQDHCQQAVVYQAEDSVVLESIRLAITIADLYRGVTLATED
jgi:uncharacterized protein